jgi:hypothetical protein
MLHSVEGIYRNGKIELTETPPNTKEGRVIVTFLPPDGPVDLRKLDISAEEAAEMRWRLQSFEEDWNRPDMDVYNDM